jgi:phosphatidylserine/phosphatidylglycerophosphate/cardiolipin synthase-like enzyme
MKRKDEMAAVLAVLRSAPEPLRASQIARELDIPRSRVNSLLHANLDTVFRKDTENFTRTPARAGEREEPATPPPTDAVRVEAHFAPGDEPITALCDVIDEATSSILVQAYYLRSDRIAKALIRAKRRRVRVRVLLGCTTTSSRPSRDTEIRHGGNKHAVPKLLHKAGIEVLEDHGETNNHNKCIVVDGCVTATGGLNFCDYAADNADNIVIIRSRVIAEQFAHDWERNRKLAARFEEDGG